ncbi:AraC-like DNA-binding protein [Variovorax sp. TBS-050B]|uniref:AraC family transcriptional regulator n=1 Tax=Variovorax sp. TBS-050B TaxID=2940551 RepID=UPI002476611F|nr:AraC family transcriptional regulator [Variovorax sp. TBS-050B]MDH6593003.1 AraC-like DNA-binding protein [Variovorax sp. TBS-050B]
MSTFFPPQAPGRPRKRGELAARTEALEEKAVTWQHNDAPPSPVNLKLVLVDPDGLAFLRSQGDAVDIYRPAASVPEEGQMYPFHLLLKMSPGPTVVEQCGRVATLQDGDMTLLDSNEAMRLRSSQGNDAWIIGLATSLITRWLPNAQDAIALRLDGSEGWSGVLSSYIRSLDIRQVQLEGGKFQREFVAEHIMSMLSFSLAQTGVPSLDTDAVPPRDRAMHAHMCDWIRDNYADAEVTAAKMAAHFNLSTRYVHKVFASAGRGVTFRDALQQERLEAARRLLRPAAGASMPIAQVAYRCGFSDPAYFGLVFRKKYGCSPGAFAQAQKAEAGT